MNKLGIVGLISIFVLVVAISGCTSMTQTLSNYTDGYISFDYPSDFTNISYPGDLYSGGNQWKLVTFLANSDYTDILVKKVDNAAGATPETIGPLAATQDTSQGSTLLGSARYTNPNGVQMWKITDSVIDSTLSNNPERIYYTVYFNQGNSMYMIQVYGDKSKQADVQTVANTVFNSTKVL